MLFSRLQTIIEPQLLEAQCSFRPGRSTVDQTWVTQQIVDGATAYHTPVHFGFADLTKIYESVNQSALMMVLKLYGVPQELVNLNCTLVPSVM